MLNERLNISKIKSYIHTSLSTVCSQRFLSMPTAINKDWSKFMVIEVISAKEDMMMGVATALISVWTKMIGEYGLEDTKNLDSMETTLLNLIDSHCINSNYSMYYAGGGYDVADNEKRICGRLYEIKIQVK